MRMIILDVERDNSLYVPNCYKSVLPYRTCLDRTLIVSTYCTDVHIGGIHAVHEVLEFREYYVLKLAN